MTKQLAILFIAAVFLIGCDSDPNSERPENEDPVPTGVITADITNTGSAEYPGDPNSLVLRAIGSPDGGQRIVDFPASGMTRTVDLRTRPGNYKVGIIAYDSTSGEASFGAVTREEKTVTAGETIDVDLSSRTRNWTGFEIDKLEGEWAVGEKIRLYVQNSPPSVFANPEWDGRSDNSILYYGPEAFSYPEESAYKHTEFAVEASPVSDIRSFSPNLVLKTEVVDSFVGRLQVSINPDWDGPTQITRPHPENPPQDILDRVTGSISVTFQKDK